VRRRLGTLTALTVLALAFTATPVSAGAVQVFLYPAVQLGDNGPLVVACEARTYTATSGSFLIVTRDTSSAAHLSAINVHAVDQDGQPYLVLGSETYVDLGGRLTTKLMFVGQGVGMTDSVNVVFRLSPDGGFLLNFGTCGV
jgi:hypothetical protein